jgi:protein-L-isoaspartate(D-aspartate) O-methyltransferase
MNTDTVRRQMVEQQIRTCDVSDVLLLDTLEQLPRERFVPDAFRQLAYADTEIPLPHGECMMRPSVEGQLLQALELEAEDRVLEIGTGSAYLTACLSRLAGEVLSVDLHADFLDRAGKLLDELQIRNVTLQQRDVVREAYPDGRFDVVAITGSMPTLDERLLQHLEPGGRLFVVTGAAPIMEAQLVLRGADDSWHRSSLFETLLPRLRNIEEPPAFAF